MKAVLCPVCNGDGKGKIAQSQGGQLINMEALRPDCNGCDGKGWIEVHENNCEKYIIHEYPEWPPYYPRPYPQYEPYWSGTGLTIYMDWKVESNDNQAGLLYGVWQ